MSGGDLVINPNFWLEPTRMGGEVVRVTILAPVRGRGLQYFFADRKEHPDVFRLVMEIDRKRGSDSLKSVDIPEGKSDQDAGVPGFQACSGERDDHLHVTVRQADDAVASDLFAMELGNEDVCLEKGKSVREKDDGGKRVGRTLCWGRTNRAAV